MTPVTASLTTNSDAADTSGMGTVPDGIPASFATAGGTFSPMVATTVSGVATSTLTAGVTGGPFLAEATVDGETQSDGYTVTNAPTADLEVAVAPALTILDDGAMGMLTLTFTNAGPSAVTGASISADFPAELASLTWTCTGSGTATCESPSGSGDLAQTVDLLAGETITVEAQATATNPYRGILGLSAAASNVLADPDPSDDTAAAEIRSLTIFTDGFESGDTSAWSTTMGGP